MGIRLDEDGDDCNTEVFNGPIDFLKPRSIHMFQTTPVPRFAACPTPCTLPDATLDQRILRAQKEQHDRVDWNEVKGKRYMLRVHERPPSQGMCAGNCFEPYPPGDLIPLDDDVADGDHLMDLPELTTKKDLDYFGFARLRDGDVFYNNDRLIAVRPVYIGSRWRDKIIGGWFLEQHPSMHFWAPSPTCAAPDSYIFCAAEEPGSKPGFYTGKVFKYAKIPLEPGTMLVSGPKAYHTSGFREGVHFFGISGESLEDENKEVDGVQPLTVCGKHPRFAPPSQLNE